MSDPATLERALEHKVITNLQSHKTTVREVLQKILLHAWENREETNLRAFGNQWWGADLACELAYAGFTSARFDDEGNLEWFDEAEADKFVVDLIHHMTRPQSPNIRRVRDENKTMV